MLAVTILTNDATALLELFCL